MPRLPWAVAVPLGTPAERNSSMARSWCARDSSVRISSSRKPIDWSFSNLLFHHFAAEANRRILTEMHRVSTLGTVIVDLRNALLARALIRLLLPLLAVGRVASHDGRLSTDQAWTMEQVRQVISRFPVRELRRRFPFRFSLVIGGRMVPREPPIDNPPLKPTPGS